MEDLNDNSLIYPAGFNELAKRRAAIEFQTAQQDDLQAQLIEKIARPADATVRGIGDLAIQSITGGILQPTYDTEVHTYDSVPATREQTLALGAVSLRDYMLRDATPSVVTEEAILGSAHLRQAA